MLSLLRTHPTPKLWKEILTLADQTAGRIVLGYPEDQAREHWSDYVDTQLMANLDQYPEFKREIQLYGGATFLKSLITVNYSTLR